MRLENVQPQQVVFHEELHRNDNAVVFLVSVAGFKCVMKVERGVTETGYIPQFYGSVESVNPRLWQPHLDMFASDTNLPNAIFIEYIPGMRQLHLNTFTKERMDKFVHAAEAVTAALVMHNDLKPRNFMIAPGDPERVVLLDFDRARTYDADSVTAEQQEWLREDVQIVRDLARLLEQDVALGHLKHSYLYFCT